MIRNIYSELNEYYIKPSNNTLGASETSMAVYSEKLNKHDKRTQRRETIEITYVDSIRKVTLTDNERIEWLNSFKKKAWEAKQNRMVGIYVGRRNIPVVDTTMTAIDSVKVDSVKTDSLLVMVALDSLAGDSVFADTLLDKVNLDSLVADSVRLDSLVKGTISLQDSVAVLKNSKKAKKKARRSKKAQAEESVPTVDSVAMMWFSHPVLSNSYENEAMALFSFVGLEPEVE